MKATILGLRLRFNPNGYLSRLEVIVHILEKICNRLLKDIEKWFQEARP